MNSLQLPILEDSPYLIFSTKKSQLYGLQSFDTKSPIYWNWFKYLHSMTLTEEPDFQLFGKPCKMRRHIGFFSNQATEYNFSGRKFSSSQLTVELQQMIDWVNQQFKTQFNGILINRYINGHHYISQHSDNEKELDPSGQVVSLTFGMTGRTLRISSSADIQPEFISDQIHQINDKTYDYKMKLGCFLIMAGSFQEEFKHGIPMEKNNPQERISLTFRYHKC